MKLYSSFFIALITLASCGGKKIYVDAKGHAKIDKDNKTIVLKDGAGTEQVTESFSGSDNLSLKIKKEDGDATVDITGKGLFYVNCVNDTIIGSYLHFGEQKKDVIVTQAEILKSIDSLQQLTENKNVSFEKHTFYILPFHATKISENNDAMIVAPYHQLTSLEKENKEPEVYRFYSIKEIREKIEKQKAMTVAPEDMPVKK